MVFLEIHNVPLRKVFVNPATHTHTYNIYIYIYIYIYIIIYSLIIISLSTVVHSRHGQDHGLRIIFTSKNHLTTGLSQLECILTAVVML